MINENDSIKQITFDLDTTTEGLQKYYNKDVSSAYSAIRTFLQKNGFEHTQGSVYESTQKMPHYQVEYVLNKLFKANTWLPCSTKNITISSIYERSQYHTPNDRAKAQQEYANKQESASLTRTTQAMPKNLTFGQIKEILATRKATPTATSAKQNNMHPKQNTAPTPQQRKPLERYRDDEHIR